MSNFLIIKTEFKEEPTFIGPMASQAQKSDLSNLP
jgi:hypothetical protein